MCGHNMQRPWVIAQYIWANGALQAPPATCRVRVWYLNLGQQYVDGYAFFHVHCGTKPSENPKIFNSQVDEERKCVFSIVLAG